MFLIQRYRHKSVHQSILLASSALALCLTSPTALHAQQLQPTVDNRVLDSSDGLTISPPAEGILFGGQITGSGSLVIDGLGDFLITTVQPYSGELTVRKGLLRLDIDAALNPAGKAVLETDGVLNLKGHSLTLSEISLKGGEISNGRYSGSLKSQGGRISNLRGTADLVVDAGITDLTGILIFNSLNVGAATLRNTAFDNLVFVDKDVVFNKDSIYSVRMTESRISQLNVTGKVDFGGATLSITLDDVVPANWKSNELLLVSSDGGITNSFGKFVFNGPDGFYIYSINSGKSYSVILGNYFRRFIWIITSTDVVDLLGGSHEYGASMTLRRGTLQNGTLNSVRGNPIKVIGGTISNIKVNADLSAEIEDSFETVYLTGSNVVDNLTVKRDVTLYVSGDTKAKKVIVANGGTFYLGDGVTNGTLDSDINSDGTVIFNPGADLIWSKVVSGEGLWVAFGGNGTILLTAVQTYVATTVIHSTLKLGIDYALNSNIELRNYGTLNLDRYKLNLRKIELDGGSIIGAAGSELNGRLVALGGGGTLDNVHGNIDVDIRTSSLVHLKNGGSYNLLNLSDHSNVLIEGPGSEFKINTLLVQGGSLLTVNSGSLQVTDPVQISADSKVVLGGMQLTATQIGHV